MKGFKYTFVLWPEYFSYTSIEPKQAQVVNVIANIHQFHWWLHFFCSSASASGTSLPFWEHSLPQDLLSEPLRPEGWKTAAGSHPVSFRFQGAFLPLITNSQNQNSSKTLTQFRALTDHDKCNVRWRQMLPREDEDYYSHLSKSLSLKLPCFYLLCVMFRSILLGRQFN